MRSPRFSVGKNRDKDYFRISDEGEDAIIPDETVHSKSTCDEGCDEFVVDISPYLKSPYNHGQSRPDSYSLKSNSTDDSFNSLFKDIDIYNSDFSHDDASISNDDYSRINMNRNIDDQIISENPRNSHTETEAIGEISFDRQRIESNLEMFDRIPVNNGNRCLIDETKIQPRIGGSNTLEHTSNAHAFTIRHQESLEESAAHDCATANSAQVTMTFFNNVFESFSPLSVNADFEDPFIKPLNIESFPHRPKQFMIDTTREGIPDVFLAIRGLDHNHDILMIDGSNKPSSQELIVEKELQDQTRNLQDISQFRKFAVTNKYQELSTSFTGVDYCDFFSSDHKTMAGELTEEIPFDLTDKLTQCRIKIAQKVEKLKARRSLTQNNEFVDVACSPADKVKSYEKSCKKQIDNNTILLFDSSESQHHDSRDDEIDCFDRRIVKLEVEERSCTEIGIDVINVEVAPYMRGSYLTLDELKLMKCSHANFFNREYLLSDKDFCTYLGMPKEEWKNIPEWKRMSRKRQLGIL